MTEQPQKAEEDGQNNNTEKPAEKVISVMTRAMSHFYSKSYFPFKCVFPHPLCPSKVNHSFFINCRRKKLKMVVVVGIVNS